MFERTKPRGMTRRGSKTLHIEGFKSIIQMLGDTESGRRTWKRKEGRGETNGFNTD